MGKPSDAKKARRKARKERRSNQRQPKPEQEPDLLQECLASDDPMARFEEMADRLGGRWARRHREVNYLDRIKIAPPKSSAKREHRGKR